MIFVVIVILDFVFSFFFFRICLAVLSKSSFTLSGVESLSCSVFLVCLFDFFKNDIM